jgi:HEAT repeat protein
MAYIADILSRSEQLAVECAEFASEIDLFPFFTHHRKPLVRFTAVVALGRNIPAALPSDIRELLEDLAVDSEFDVRSLAIVLVKHSCLPDLLASVEDQRTAVLVEKMLAGALEKGPRYVLHDLLVIEELMVRITGRPVCELVRARAFPLVVEATRSPDAQVKTQAIKLLGAFRDERSVKTLIKRLKSNDPVVQVAAANALEEMGSHEVRAALLRRICAASPVVRDAVFHALITLFPEYRGETIPSLYASVDDDIKIFLHGEISRQLSLQHPARAGDTLELSAELGESTWDDRFWGLLATDESALYQKLVKYWLRKAPDRLNEHLLAEIVSGDEARQRLASDTVADAEEADSTSFRPFLSHLSPEEQARLVSQLLARVASGPIEARTRSISTLGRLGIPAVKPDLLPFLYEPNARIQQAVESALVDLTGQPWSEPEQRDHLALEMLRQMNHGTQKQVVLPLIRSLVSPDALISDGAGIALQRLDPVSRPLLVEHLGLYDPVTRSRVVQHLSKRDPTLRTKGLVGFINEQPAEVQRRILSQILNRLKHPSRKMRVDALNLLRDFRIDMVEHEILRYIYLVEHGLTLEAANALTVMFPAKYPLEPENIIRTGSEQYQRKAIDHLITLLGLPQERSIVLNHAADLLCAVGAPVVPVLIEVFAGKNERAKQGAAIALERLHYLSNDPLIQHLLALLESGAHERDPQVLWVVRILNANLETTLVRIKAMVLESVEEAGRAVLVLSHLDPALVQARLDIVLAPLLTRLKGVAPKARVLPPEPQARLHRVLAAMGPAISLYLSEEGLPEEIAVASGPLMDILRA